MIAIAEACRAGNIPADIGLVISNDASAPGLEAARRRGLKATTIERRQGDTREAHDATVAEALESAGVHLVCLAGYMRLLSAAFIRRFPGRIMNVHPALLPSFPGLHAQRQAIEKGVRLSGVTVHFVDEGLDSGPIILQAAVPVERGDTEETLAARILEQEHVLYPQAIRLFFEGRLRIDGRRVHIAAR